jgi:glycoprotease/Kae1 family metallohydrolase
MGIETSCDDTCISVINGIGEILVNYQIGQNDIHKEYGGVHPMFAKQAHQENLNIYMDKALQDIYDKYSRYPDVIGFTIGPGLEVCLVAGVSKVYEISHRFNIPIIPTHHMESHIMVCRIPGLNLGVEYPFVCCVVSGGHTFIAYVEAEGVYRLLSTTTDDSMGETIDKVGRELGLVNIPAGRDFEELAIGGDNKRFAFPRTSIKKKPYDLSFSGLKSFTIGAIKKNIQIPDTDPLELKQLRADFAASFQEHIMEYLVSQFRKIHQKFLYLKSALMRTGELILYLSH